MSWNAFEMESVVRSTAAESAVWDVLRDVKGWPRWAGVCVSSDIGDGFDWHEGQRLRFRLRMLGVPVPFDVAVTESVEGERVAWASTEFTITATRTISTERHEQGVVIRDHKAFHSPALPIGLVYPRFLIRRMTDSWLRDLASEAERRSGT